MTDNTTLRRHRKLVHAMAEANGVDLDEAMFEGRIDPETLEEAVLSCTACAEADTCEGCLADSPKLDHAPDYCRNGALFEELKAPL